MTISAGPFRLAFMYSTGLYTAWSAESFARCDVSLPAVGDGLPNLGCATTTVAMPNASAAATAVVACMQDVLFIMSPSVVANTGRHFGRPALRQ
jgi:hypothetical protein